MMWPWKRKKIVWQIKTRGWTCGYFTEDDYLSPGRSYYCSYQLEQPIKEIQVPVAGDKYTVQIEDLSMATGTQS